MIAYYKILKEIFAEETSHEIDVGVYSSAKDIVKWIWEKLIPGGVIFVDDRGFHTCTGVTRLVEENRHLKDRFILHNLNGHALMIKLK